MTKNILGVKAPKKDCTDLKCPFHGQLNVKKELFKGKVVKKDIHSSATIEWFRSIYVPKYERYEMRKSRMRTHNPACVDAQIGQEVLVAKTRPLSKTKNHVIIQVLKE
jgi:small subunit ribosomal protein S17